MAPLMVNLRSVKSLAIKFNPFSIDSITAREFWNTILAKKVYTTNSMCQINVELLNNDKPSRIIVDFTDNTTVTLPTYKGKFLNLINDFNTECLKRNPIDTKKIENIDEKPKKKFKKATTSKPETKSKSK